MPKIRKYQNAGTISSMSWLDVQKKSPLKMAGLPTSSTPLPKTLKNPLTSSSSVKNPLQKTSGKSNFLSSSGFSTGMSIAGDLVTTLPTADKDVNSNDATSKNIRNTVNSSLMKSGNPYAMAAGAINQGISMIGGNTDASKGLGSTNDSLNMIASLGAPGAGFFTKKTDKYSISDEVKQTTGYAGTQKDLQTATQNAGAKLLFGSGKANAMISQAKINDNKIQKIVNTGKEDYVKQATLTGLNSQKNEINKTGGVNISYYGSKGLKVPTSEDLERVKKILNPVILKEGGAINIIPDGALHARKNNIESLKGQVTPKGIPVISESEDGEIIQHAEVEKNELILHKELTLKIEELCALGTDEAAIEVGQLFSKEIFENTEDNTGLLNTIK